MKKSKQVSAAGEKSRAEAIREAINTLTGEGREVTTAAILWLLHSKGLADIRATDIYASPAWKELLATEKGPPAASAPGAAPDTQRITMPRGKKSEPSNGKKISKMDAVRQTLASQGQDITPAAIMDHVKKTYGLEMSFGTATNYKSAVLREMGKNPRRRKKKESGQSACLAACGSHRAIGAASVSPTSRP